MKIRTVMTSIRTITTLLTRGRVLLLRINSFLEIIFLKLKVKTKKS